jgi:DNA-binding NarL/FixJ family response regulator
VAKRYQLVLDGAYEAAAEDFPPAGARGHWPTVGLTTRQAEVLRLLDGGLTNAELAERLYLSVKTVDHHVSAILTKLDITNRRNVVRRARELGLLT